jgi:hypothetical protein
MARSLHAVVRPKKGNNILGKISILLPKEALDRADAFIDGPLPIRSKPYDTEVTSGHHRLLEGMVRLKGTGRRVKQAPGGYTGTAWCWDS